MFDLLLGVIPIYAKIVVILTVIVSILLIIIVLLQKGKGGGLSAAFGGAGGQSAFGGKTGDVFTWATIVGAGLFLALAMISTMVYKPEITTQETVAPAIQPAAAPGVPAVDAVNLPANQDNPTAAMELPAADAPATAPQPAATAETPAPAPSPAPEEQPAPTPPAAEKP